MRPKEYDKGPVICITLDTDSCPEKGLRNAIGILDEYGLPATFFCTDEYEPIPAPHETAIHPFVHHGNKGEAVMEPVLRLKKIYPNAVGSRCHQLACNSFLYAGLPKEGFLYESSWPMIFMDSIRPVHLPDGLIQMPIYCMETDILNRESPEEIFDWLTAPGLKVFLFHPGHVFHNTRADTYDALNQIPQAERYRPELVVEGFGVNVFLHRLLRFISERGLPCVTCKEVALSEIG